MLAAMSAAASCNASAGYPETNSGIRNATERMEVRLWGRTMKRRAADIEDSRPCERNWQSRRPGDIPFRPVTLRLHLSMSLPFSNHSALCLNGNEEIVSLHNCFHFFEQRTCSTGMAD
jgi:hypothetical protein